MFPRQAAAARHRASSSGCAADAAATAQARLPAKSSCASSSLPAPSAAIRTATEALEAIAIAGTRSGEGDQGEAEPPALFCCRFPSCSELGRDVHLVQPQDCFAHLYICIVLYYTYVYIQFGPAYIPRPGKFRDAGLPRTRDIDNQSSNQSRAQGHGSSMYIYIGAGPVQSHQRSRFATRPSVPYGVIAWLCRRLRPGEPSHMTSRTPPQVYIYI